MIEVVYATERVGLDRTVAIDLGRGACGRAEHRAPASIRRRRDRLAARPRELGIDPEPDD